MSSLTDSEKCYRLDLLEIQSGYILDYSKVDFRALFNRHKIDIDDLKYQINGTSKAKKCELFGSVILML